MTYEFGDTAFENLLSYCSRPVIRLDPVTVDSLLLGDETDIAGAETQ